MAELCKELFLPAPFHFTPFLQAPPPLLPLSLCGPTCLHRSVVAGSSLRLVPACIVYLLSRQLPPFTAPLPFEETALATGSRPARSWVFPPTSPSPPNNEMARKGEGATRSHVLWPQEPCVWQWAGHTYRLSKTHPLGLMLQVCQVLWDHGQGDFFLVLLPSSFSSRHVPKSQPVPPQTSPDLEHLPGEGTSWGTEGTGFKSPISARISFHSSGPALTTSCYSPRTISSPASSPFPPIHWISSPSPCSSPLRSLAYSLHYLLPLRLLSWCEQG